MAHTPASSHGGAAAPLTLTGRSDTTELIVKMLAAQTANPLEVRDSVDSAVANIDSVGGALFSNRVSFYTSQDISALKVIPLSTTSARIIDVLDKDGNRVFFITFEGALAVGLNAAPSDASLAAGQAALWYDSTNGASKLMVKAKQADGTVKSAAIALA